MNHYWRSPSRGRLAGRHLISESGRQFRADAVASVYDQGRPAQPLSCRVRVEVLAYPPDRRRRDLDNLLKPLLDSLVHAGVVKDDSLIDDLRIVRKHPVVDGAVIVEVAPA